MSSLTVCGLVFALLADLLVRVWLEVMGQLVYAREVCSGASAVHCTYTHSESVMLLD